MTIVIDHAKTSAMYQRERWKVILTEVRAHGVICGRESVDLTPASSAPLRCELDKLEEMGQLRRVIGGIEAVAASQLTNFSALSLGVSQTLNVERERSVAESGCSGRFIKVRSAGQHSVLQSVASPHAHNRRFSPAAVSGSTEVGA